MEVAALERPEKFPLDLKLEICCNHSGAFIFELIFFILADKKDNYKSLNELSLYFFKIPSPIMELAALEHLKNVVTTLAPSFLFGSSSFLQVTRLTKKA